MQPEGLEASQHQRARCARCTRRQASARSARDARVDSTHLDSSDAQVIDASATGRPQGCDVMSMPATPVNGVMAQDAPPAELIEALQAAVLPVVVGHVTPDVDAMGSMLG